MGFNMKKKKNEEKAVIENKKLHANLLLNFANSKTTDEAGLEYIRNLKSTYGLSTEIINKALIDFPKMLDQSDTENIKIIELMSQEEKLHSKIENCFWDGVHLLRYENDHDGKIILDKKVYVLNKKHPVKTILKYLPVYYNISEITGQDFARNINQQYRIEINHRWEVDECLVKNEIVPVVEEWVKVVEELIIIKLQHNNEKISDLSLTQDILRSLWYQNVGEHSYIRRNISKLDKLLQAIVDKDIDKAASISKEYINIYNHIPKAKAEVESNLKVTIKNQINDYCSINRYPTINLFYYYEWPIANSIVEVFKPPEDEKAHEIWSLMKKCHNCYKFYLANKNIPNQRFCPGGDCHDAFHNKPENKATG